MSFCHSCSIVSTNLEVAPESKENAFESKLATGAIALLTQLPGPILKLFILYQWQAYKQPEMSGHIIR